MSATVSERIARSPIRWAFIFVIGGMLSFIVGALIFVHISADHATLHALAGIEFCRQQPGHPHCQPKGDAAVAPTTPPVPPAPVKK